MTTSVGWTALGTLLLSSLLGIWGYVTLTAQPQHTVQITVDEGLPWQITQATVDAATADAPVRSWEQVTLRVTDQYFTTAQRPGLHRTPGLEHRGSGCAGIHGAGPTAGRADRGTPGRR
ncbi:hypothetical protein [Micrococcus sp. IITD107]|uniref:hypothetical protein n=1 Tax=Micrococcus sp. IITD107 TaxID=3342790 RepID=UPI0035BB1FE1